MPDNTAPSKSFEREVLDRLTIIEQKIDSYSNAKAKTYENEKKLIELEHEVSDQEDRIKVLEEKNTWLSRTIVAAVIAAAVGVVFTLARMGAGI